MNKRLIYIVLSAVSAFLFALMLVLSVTEIFNISALYSLIPLAVAVVFLALYFRAKSNQLVEQDFVSAERARSGEAPKFKRDFEIVRDCCENIITHLKREQNIVAVSTVNDLMSDDFEGYYMLKVDSFELLDCLYFFTQEQIEKVNDDFLAVLEDAFLARKFYEVDATYSADGIFMFRREKDRLSEAFYVFSENPEAFKESDFEVTKLGGLWYYVETVKNMKDLLNL